MEQIGDFSDLGLRAATPSRVDSLETAVAIAAQAGAVQSDRPAAIPRSPPAIQKSSETIEGTLRPARG
jgi:hypothetical protein